MFILFNNYLKFAFKLWCLSWTYSVFFVFLEFYLMTMIMIMTMITDLLNIIVAMNCYERAQALHAI